MTTEASEQINCRMSRELIAALDRFVADKMGPVDGGRCLAIRSLVTKALLAKGYLKFKVKKSKTGQVVKN